MIRLVAFDLDGVLYRYDREWRIGQFAERCGRSVADVRRIWQESGWEDAAERGRYGSGADYLAAFNALLGTDFSLGEWVEIRRRSMHPDVEVLKIAARVKEKAGIAVLTNNAPLLREQIARIAPELPPLFGDHIHTSADFGARKPDPALFRALMSIYDVAPGETAFIDDSPDNVAGAQALGIFGHHFVSAEALEAFLSALF